MAVRAKYGSVITYTGTFAEVAQALSDDQIPGSKIMLVYNGTNITAFVKIL